MTAIDKNSPPTATLLKEHCRYTGVPIGRKEKKNRRTREKLKCSDQSRLSPAQSEAAMFQMSFLNYLYLYIYIYIKSTCIIDIYVHGHAHIYTSFSSVCFVVFCRHRTLPSNEPKIRRQKLPAPILLHPLQATFPHLTRTLLVTSGGTRIENQ